MWRQTDMSGAFPANDLHQWAADLHVAIGQGHTKLGGGKVYPCMVGGLVNSLPSGKALFILRATKHTVSLGTGTAV
jgi:hypothetical protein